MDLPNCSSRNYNAWIIEFCLEKIAEFSQQGQCSNLSSPRGVLKTALQEYKILPKICEEQLP